MVFFNSVRNTKRPARQPQTAETSIALPPPAKTELRPTLTNAVPPITNTSDRVPASPFRGYSFLPAARRYYHRRRRRRR